MLSTFPSKCTGTLYEMSNVSSIPFGKRRATKDDFGNEMIDGFQND